MEKNFKDTTKNRTIFQLSEASKITTKNEARYRTDAIQIKCGVYQKLIIHNRATTFHGKEFRSIVSCFGTRTVRKIVNV